jgi:prepilin-type N-terminal cleavage/methylation domain-containing protein
MKKLSKLQKEGFTLIEILLVVAILSILLVVVFASLNPAQRLIDTRNARRWSDINNVLTAVHECIIDNDLATCGVDSLGVTPDQLGTCVSGGDSPCTGANLACLDITTELASYIASIPLDPSGGVDATTGYSLEMNNGIITVTACSAEDGETIAVSR